MKVRVVSPFLYCSNLFFVHAYTGGGEHDTKVLDGLNMELAFGGLEVDAWLLQEF